MAAEDPVIGTRSQAELLVSLRGFVVATTPQVKRYAEGACCLQYASEDKI